MSNPFLTAMCLVGAVLSYRWHLDAASKGQRLTFWLHIANCIFLTGLVLSRLGEVCHA